VERGGEAATVEHGNLPRKGAKVRRNNYCQKRERQKIIMYSRNHWENQARGHAQQQDKTKRIAPCELTKQKEAGHYPERDKKSGGEQMKSNQCVAGRKGGGGENAKKRTGFQKGQKRERGNPAPPKKAGGGGKNANRGEEKKNSINFISP